jgi:hypothetical protein
MATDLDAIAERLFAGVMAPLVLGGAVRPGHAIGARAALALGERRLPREAIASGLAARVDEARLRRARKLAPVDALPDPTAGDWALTAAFHDVLQAVNPIFDAPLRRGSAARILDLAATTIERVSAPSTVGEALARHTCLARMTEVTRTDTTVRWWAGTREYLGVDPPERLQAWPELRRVGIVRTLRPLLELEPLAVRRERLAATMSALLTRTPLTDLATCTRAGPRFAWSDETLAFAGTRTGRTLALRALDGLDQGQVDEALGHASRELLAGDSRVRAAAAVALLGERALLDAERGTGKEHGLALEGDVSFARALGALEARRSLSAVRGPWSAMQRAALLEALSADAQSPAAREAAALLG